MAIFEVKTEKNKDLIQLYRKLNYITDVASTQQYLIYGSAVSIYDPYAQMLAVKQVFNQTERNAYRHCILSIKTEDEISIANFKHLSMEVSELLSNFYGNYQVVMAVHIDSDNLHAHYVLNTINYLTGERFDLNRRRLIELKYRVNEILNKYNISNIKIYSTGSNNEI